MRRLALLAPLPVLLGLSVALAPGALAATPTVVASWQMNEPAGAAVMADSSGNGLSGRIGSEVLTGRAVDGATAYEFPAVSSAPPTHPAHLVTVPDNPALDPGTGSFAVTLRFRTTDAAANLVQKGQSGATGGFWKVDQSAGKVKCLFRGSTGSATVGSVTAYNDGRWHTLRCERGPTGVTMTIDTTFTRRTSVQSGAIDNRAMVSIGGKNSCNSTTVGCDYYTGAPDYVRIERG